MMLSSLFAKNPFTPLREHMKKAFLCVEATDEIIRAHNEQNEEKLKDAARKVSILEHEADVIKHDIRARLHKSVFLPVDRRDVLEVLRSMDSIADNAEDIGVLFTLRKMEAFPNDELGKSFAELNLRVRKVVAHSVSVVDRFDALIEAGFSGPDAEAVIEAVDEVGRLEHEADKAQDQFGKMLFQHENDFKPAALFMWNKIANKTGDIANSAERMCNQLRIMLAG
ncbi:MAG: TIGR00153 family protein [Deltaproteobacteria bacterium]|nr:TIGR00153 family protein [Deltaproteobacteria bacterium]